jgi:hypothetical protein
MINLEHIGCLVGIRHYSGIGNGNRCIVIVKRELYYLVGLH